MIKKILTSKTLYISIAGLIAFGALMLALFDFVLMPAYTNYNEGITVPDVTRVSLEEAVASLEDRGLRYEVAERRANTAYPSNYVIDQSPVATQIVKPNRKIYLTVNTSERPQVEVPKLRDLSLRNAQIQLQNYGLEVGVVSYESNRFKNVILRQSVPEGSMVDKGTPVDLIVSDGLGDKIVQIPEIIGLRLPEAQLKLREAGLRVEDVIFRRSREQNPNIVLDYEPKVSELIEGKSLRLIISERFDRTEQSEGGVVIDTTGTVTPPDSTNQNIPNN
ncbi:PASTA domain-containing protein [Balneola sp. MJW-20]|uniref:PASTA domain-containing protein n=1 Tax=Gracilimonas aurantiaca TaxID=3234185 RepID=UPI0034678151